MPAPSPFALPGRHPILTEWLYADRSDEHGELFWSRQWQLQPAEKNLVLSGNLVSAEDPATGAGLVWIRLAPSAAVRKWDTAPSLRIERLGNGAWQAVPGATALDYATQVLRYSDGAAGRTRALHAWQRSLQPQPDGLFLTNTWGDRSRADKMSEEFLLAEIDQAARLGVEVVQLDDGWQKGRSANTVERGGVWNDFWATAADYWAPDPGRFPRGLEPLIARARDFGVQLGLWYAPDSARECDNWEKDAAMLISLWRRHGVAHFKLDAVKLFSPLSEERFRALLDRVQSESAGAVRFDLDTTAEARLGFWGRPAGTAVFVQNRYTDWGNYYPHATLRTLWQLAHTVHPARLRLEFLNHTRNAARYGDDPLAPARYTPDWLFASIMLASPLGWFENTGLGERQIEALAPLVALWKEHRAALHGGDVLPVGEPYDGHSWSGFVVLDPHGVAQHLLAFRGLNDRPAATWILPGSITLPARWVRLAGAGSLAANAGTLVLTGPTPLGYGWWRAVA